jgi:Na+/H+-translocating membrane pyrophosphatase
VRLAGGGKGVGGVRVARARAVAGAQAGSAAVPPGLAESFEHGAVMALQLCLPDHVGE